MQNIDRTGNRIKKKEFIRNNIKTFDRILFLDEPKNTPEGQNLISEIRKTFEYSESTVDVDVIGAFYKPYENVSGKEVAKPKNTCINGSARNRTTSQPITMNKKKQFATRFLTTLASFEKNLELMLIIIK